MDAGSADADARSKGKQPDSDGDGSPTPLGLDDAAAAEVASDDDHPKDRGIVNGIPAATAASSSDAAAGSAKAKTSSKAASATKAAKGVGKGKGNHPMNAGILKLMATRTRLKQEQKSLAKEIKLEGKKRSRTLRNAKKLTDEELVQVVVARGCSQLVQPMIDKTAAAQTENMVD
jgi:hypothetical protein